MYETTAIHCNPGQGSGDDRASCDCCNEPSAKRTDCDICGVKVCASCMDTSYGWDVCKGCLELDSGLFERLCKEKGGPIEQFIVEMFLSPRKKYGGSITGVTVTSAALILDYAMPGKKPLEIAISKDGLLGLCRED